MVTAAARNLVPQPYVASDDTGLNWWIIDGGRVVELCGDISSRITTHSRWLISHYCVWRDGSGSYPKYSLSYRLYGCVYTTVHESRGNRNKREVIVIWRKAASQRRIFPDEEFDATVNCVGGRPVGTLVDSVRGYNGYPTLNHGVELTSFHRGLGPLHQQQDSFIKYRSGSRSHTLLFLLPRDSCTVV